MPEFLKSAFASNPNIKPVEVLLRLVVAWILGSVVAWIYRRTRRAADVAPTFPLTLILLSILIGVVTQVIGDNVARAFSLVGALSIVRFRTVVRDTQDTAFVIFAVVVGMAVGANDYWVALIGILVVGLAAAFQQVLESSTGDALPAFRLDVRLAAGLDPETVLGSTLQKHLDQPEVVGVTTAKQGTCLDLSYRGTLRVGETPAGLVRSLNALGGVERAELIRRDTDED